MRKGPTENDPPPWAEGNEGSHVLSSEVGAAFAHSVATAYTPEGL